MEGGGWGGGKSAARKPRPNLRRQAEFLEFEHLDDICVLPGKLAAAQDEHGHEGHDNGDEHSDLRPARDSNQLGSFETFVWKRKRVMCCGAIERAIRGDLTGGCICVGRCRCICLWHKQRVKLGARLI
jgi:hypothetical protein